MDISINTEVIQRALDYLYSIGKREIVEFNIADCLIDAFGVHFNLKDGNTLGVGWDLIRKEAWED